VEEFLLKRVAAGEPGAVNETLDRYGGLVWSLARRMCSNATEAEDAAQEIFVEVWKSAARYDETMGGEATFIATIARRRLIDRIRKKGREPAMAPVMPNDAQGGPQGQDAPGRRAELDDDAAAAARLLAELPPDQQKVIRMSIQSGMSHERIAQATGLPLGTVKTHIRRGLRRVRDALLEQNEGTAEQKRVGAKQ
jgi:RNA polymerase sigma-70 factor (ECF subfamily)